MTVKPTLVYLHALADQPGVVGSHVWMSVFNPLSSTKAIALLSGTFDSYASGATAVLESMQAFRISAASVGTLITASAVNRLDTTWPDPVAECRIGNPTITTVGTPLRAFAPVISTGAGQSAGGASSLPAGSLVCYPGQGVAVRTDGGDIDQIWNIQLVWAEFG